MTEPVQRAMELAREVETVVDVLNAAVAHFAGLDQADTARHLELRPRQSALRTRLEHAAVTVDRVADWLRDAAERAAQTPPPAGPPIVRDQGPI